MGRITLNCKGNVVPPFFPTSDVQLADRTLLKIYYSSIVVQLVTTSILSIFKELMCFLFSMKTEKLRR